jgi:hypothetical protein
MMGRMRGTGGMMPNGVSRSFQKPVECKLRTAYKDKVEQAKLRIKGFQEFQTRIESYQELEKEVRTRLLKKVRDARTHLQEKVGYQPSELKFLQEGYIEVARCVSLSKYSQIFACLCLDGTDSEN